MKSTRRQPGTPLLMVLVIAAGLPACRGPSKGQSTVKAPRISERDVQRYRSLAAVNELREKAATRLEEGTMDRNPQVRANAAEGLAEAPQRLQGVMQRLLADPNAGVRSTAAMMIGRLQLRNLVGNVRPLTQDSSPFVAASAIYAVSRCGEAVDITRLADSLLKDPSPRVRAHVAFLLGELGEQTATGLLRDAAKAKIPRASAIEMRLMQLQIAEALVKLGVEEQLDVIRAALYPSRPEDLEAAALAVQIIGQVKDRRATDQLIYLTAYNDKQEGRMPAEVRLGAAMSLAMLGNDRGSFIADEFAAHPVPALRAQAAFVYGQIGRPENLPRLERLMEDPDPATQIAAAAGALKAGGLIAQQQFEGR